jgi:hypothetical protein
VAHGFYGEARLRQTFAGMSGLGTVRQDCAPKSGAITGSHANSFVIGAARAMNGALSGREKLTPIIFSA